MDILRLVNIFFEILSRFEKKERAHHLKFLKKVLVRIKKRELLISRIRAKKVESDIVHGANLSLILLSLYKIQYQI